ncbi:MAG TPA: SRPBCC family protein [Longimicrobium sp.]|jgi:hypothetical protein
MARIQATATAEIDAPAEVVYGVFADYRVGHPSILPKRHFSAWEVESGGRGAGTVVRFRMRVLGVTRPARGVVTEPEPGRVLVETYPADDIVTTFTVDPLPGGRSRVTIVSDMPRHGGIVGWIEGLVVPRALRPVFAEELRLLAEYVRGRPVPA